LLSRPAGVLPIVELAVRVVVMQTGAFRTSMVHPSTESTVLEEKQDLITTADSATVKMEQIGSRSEKEAF
jgi:hypothetical protein